MINQDTQFFWDEETQAYYYYDPDLDAYVEYLELEDQAQRPPGNNNRNVVPMPLDSPRPLLPSVPTFAEMLPVSTLKPVPSGSETSRVGVSPRSAPSPEQGLPPYHPLAYDEPSGTEAAGTVSPLPAIQTTAPDEDYYSWAQQGEVAASPGQADEEYPAESPVASPVTSPRETIQVSPVPSPVPSAQASPRTWGRESPVPSPQLSPRSWGRASPFPSLPPSAQASPRGSAQASPRGSAQASPRGSAQASPRGSAQPSPRGSAQASPRTSPRIIFRASPTASPEPTPGASPTASPAVTPEGSPVPSPAGSPRVSFPASPAIPTPALSDLYAISQVPSPAPSDLRSETHRLAPEGEEDAGQGGVRSIKTSPAGFDWDSINPESFGISSPDTPPEATPREASVLETVIASTSVEASPAPAVASSDEGDAFSQRKLKRRGSIKSVVHEMSAKAPMELILKRIAEERERELAEGEAENNVAEGELPLFSHFQARSPYRAQTSPMVPSPVPPDFGGKRSSVRFGTHHFHQAKIAEGLDAIMRTTLQEASNEDLVYDEEGG